MKEKIHENNLDALKVGVAKSHEEMAAHAVVLKKLAKQKIDKHSGNGGHRQEDPGNGRWMAFRRGLDEVGARGEKVAKGLADEIKRHPLLGGMAAFGLGFVIARLLFRRSKRDSGQ
jgi:hypothetical protein